MSRKSKRNQPAAASPQPQVEPEPRRMSRRNVFIAAVVALLVAFVAATLFYRSEKTQSAQVAATKSQAALASEQSPKFGNPAAKVHIVEFLDPACGTCRDFHPIVRQMVEDNPGRIRVTVRYAPFHPNSDYVVKVIEAARMQGKWQQALEALFAEEAATTLDGDSGDAPHGRAPDATLVERVEESEGSLELLLEVPHDLWCMRGHFDGFPVVPGVVQLQWVLDWAGRWRGAEVGARGLEALKFKQLLVGGARFRLRLERTADEAKLRFRLWNEAGDFSSGRVILAATRP